MPTGRLEKGCGTPTLYSSRLSAIQRMFAGTVLKPVVTTFPLWELCRLIGYFCRYFSPSGSLGASLAVGALPIHDPLRDNPTPVLFPTSCSEIPHDRK